MDFSFSGCSASLNLRYKCVQKIPFTQTISPQCGRVRWKNRFVFFCCIIFKFAWRCPHAFTLFDCLKTFIVPFVFLFVCYQFYCFLPHNLIGCMYLHVIYFSKLAFARETLRLGLFVTRFCRAFCGFLPDFCCTLLYCLSNAFFVFIFPHNLMAFVFMLYCF